MFLKHQSSGDLVEVLDIPGLFNPTHRAIRGQLHCGEELPDEDEFAKQELIFPSGEALPRCWTDPGYRH